MGFHNNFCVVLILMLAINCYDQARIKEVCIDSPHSSCEVTNSIDSFCQSASYWKDDIVVRFPGGTHLLNRTCELNDVNNVTLRGESESKPVVQCSKHADSGFVFRNVSMLRISGIEFTGCGAKQSFEHNYKTQFGPSAALLFVKGSNLTLVNVTVSNASPAGIYIQDVVGNVTVNSCVIRNASSHQRHTLRGNVVKYEPFITADTYLSIVDTQITNCGLNHNRFHQCDNSGLFTSKQASGLMLLIASSRVTISINNTNLTHNRGCEGGNMYINLKRSVPVTISHTNLIAGHAMDHGGNLLMILIGTASVAISQSNFIRGYTGGHGGNFYVLFDRFAPVNISQSNFKDGSGADGYGGGVFVTVVNEQVYYNEGGELLRIADSNIANNVAGYLGGGMFIKFWQPPQCESNLTISIINSSFYNNSLKSSDASGMAVYILTIKQSGMTCTHDFHVTISHCNFFNHHFNLVASVIEVQSTPFLAIDSVAIHSNNGTAISVVESELLFSGSSQIMDNTAMTGAGLLLVNSFIYLTPSTDLVIANNLALEKGGGMRILDDTGCMIASDYNDNCFLDGIPTVMDSMSITIRNNHAAESGDNIFGEYYRSCSIELDMLHVPANTVKNPSSVTSKPQKLCIGHHTRHKCGNFSSATIYPGQNIVIPLYVVGELQGAVPGTVLASITNEGGINNAEKAQEVGVSGGNITYTIYSSRSFIKNVRLYLQPVRYGCSSLDATSKAVVHITFKDCPFGFINTNSTPGIFECKCSSNRIITSCSIASQTITKTKYSWVGIYKLNNHSYLATNKYCPLDYCNSVLDLKVTV